MRQIRYLVKRAQQNCRCVSSKLECMVPVAEIVSLKHWYPCVWYSDKSFLPEGQPNRLVGTASLSFTRKTRETYDTLQPPDDSAFLLNMAVDKEFRR